MKNLAFPMIALLATACGGTTPADPTLVGTGGGGGDTTETPERPPESPPASGPSRDVAFPEIVRTTLSNDLEVNSVAWNQLPIVYLRLAIKSGAETDPANRPGLAHLVGAMLKEGTRSRSSSELAEEVHFLGADLWVDDDDENVYVNMRALNQHLPAAMAILADVTMNPAFRGDELGKLKRRELDRLSLAGNDPNFLASREFYRHLYGEHPYSRVDTTPAVVNAVSRGELTRWHRQHFVANNATLAVVGDVTPAEVQAAATEAFSSWRTGTVPTVEYPTPPTRDSREVVLIDREESVQSVILIGNLALARANPDYVPLRVANQVLGGSAASRLFMDLREQRSLTYGAYSGVGEAVQPATFRARASVRNEVTGEAMGAFFEHLNRITTEAAPAEELDSAHRYLSDSFPLRIDTPGKLAYLVTDLRIYGLPDNYWDGYRSSIREVDAAGALSAAQSYIRPDEALIVVVGKAAEVAESLRAWGPVTVLNTEGEVTQRLEAAPAE